MFNDSSYGSEHVQFREREMDPSLANFNWPDFGPVAEALGGHGVTVRSLQDIAKVEDAIASGKRPLLVDVKMSPDRAAATVVIAMQPSKSQRTRSSKNC